jgi:L,D-peptidoglycan transpeptidase YkuD (ErfK/YbiS/YcfS/YnhG family)
VSLVTTRSATLLTAAACLALAGCGGGEPVAAPTSATGSPTSTTTTPSSTTTTTTTKATTTTRTSTPSTTRTAKPKATTAKPKPKPKPTPAAARCAVPSGVTADQVVLVKASGASATVRACRRSGSHYVVELGPYHGHVGRNGVSWSKREGDLRTPAGTFPLRGGFGARGNPGLAQGWFRVDANDVWVDDPGSSLYNTHQRKPVNRRWTSAENLLNTPAYNYAQVIGYNESRTPGKGSAIFFHVDTGGGTAGCVSLPTTALLAVFRWEKPGAVMSIS